MRCFDLSHGQGPHLAACALNVHTEDAEARQLDPFTIRWMAHNALIVGMDLVLTMAGFQGMGGAAEGAWRQLQPAAAHRFPVYHVPLCEEDVALKCHKAAAIPNGWDADACCQDACTAETAG